MKFKTILFPSVLATLICLPTLSQADNTHELTLINHYKHALSFKVGINPDVLPDITDNLKIEPNQQIKTRVIDTGKEAYIRGEDKDNNSAFFGVQIVNDKNKVYGYVSKGIAFSWNTEKVVFCTPDDYKDNGSCL